MRRTTPRYSMLRTSSALAACDPGSATPAAPAPAAGAAASIAGASVCGK